ncbi:MAG: PKD domain-containing protein, partial [Flavobacteriales bacterium]
LFIQNLIIGGEYQFQVASICDPAEEPIFSSSSFFRTVCFECPEGASPENEVCGGTNNNGCNVTPNSFQDISCNETICGTATWDGTTRDTDWFQFTVTAPTVYTITAQAEFDFVLIFVNPNNCVNPTVITSGVFDACEEGELSALLAPGTYAAFIAPTFEQPTFDCSTGGNTYYLTLSADVPPAVIFPVADLCETSAPVFLQGTPSGGTWSGVGITDPNFGEFDPSISGAGQFVITYTVEVNNCPSTASVTINVGNGAETPAVPSGDTEICSGTSQSVYTVEPIAGASSYVWVLTPTAAGTISGTSTTATVTWNADYFGDASIVVAAITGCGIGNFSNSLDVAVLPVPVAPISIFGPVATCETETQLIAVGSPFASSFNWSVTPEEAGTFSGSDNAVNFITAPGFSGNVVISVTAENACGVSEATTFNMQVLPLPFADFVGLAAEYCDADGDVALTGIPLGGTFSISGGNGMVNNIFQPSVAGAGTYQITYTITVGNCTNTNTQTVVVNAGPVASFNTLPETICRQEAPIQLVGAPEGGAFSGNGVVGNVFNPAVAGAGLQTVTYTFIESGNACPGVASQVIEVLQGPVVTLGPLSSSFCLNSAPEVLTGSPALGTFTINGVEASVFDPLAQGLGQHVVRYEIDNGTCIGFAETTVTVIENIQVAINGLNNNYCTNDSPVTLTSTPAGATFSGAGVVNNVFNPSSLPAGTYTITASFSDGNCTATVTQQVVINAEPVALFSYNANGFNVAFINNSTNATSYSWDFGDGNTSTEQNPTHLYGQNGNYLVTLTATSENCGSDTYTAQVLLTVGIGEIEGLDGLQLYPNPTRNVFNLTFNSSRNENYEIRLTDAVGRLIHLENVRGAGNFNKVYDMSDKADGVYFLTISSNKGAVNYKVVKQ